MLKITITIPKPDIVRAVRIPYAPPIMPTPKQKSVKQYTLTKALPAFQTSKEIGELDWGTPQGQEAW